MKKSKRMDYYDVTAHLVERFGPVGSASWKAEEDRAWEEYNADILRNIIYSGVWTRYEYLQLKEKKKSNTPKEND